MNRGTTLTSLTLAGVFTLAGASAQASGFQLQEQSASGLGVAFSGMPAAAQDASTVFWNPAAMPLLQGTQLAASADYIDTSFKFRSSGSTYDAFGNGGDAGSGNIAPAVYGKFSLTPDLAFGLALNVPFGLETEWNSQWAGMFAAIRSKVHTYNINPTVGYKVNDWLFVGAGVSYQKLTATLTSALSPLAPTVQGKLRGNDWAFGWNAGVLAQFGDEHQVRVGATYRAAMDYTIDGTLSVNSTIPTFAVLNSSVNSDIKLPATIAVGSSYQVLPSFRVLADVTWTRWDSVQALTIVATSGPLAGRPVSNTTLNFKNSWRAGVGAEYQLAPAWILRGGLAYDNSPVQDQFRTPKLPDNDRRWVAAGVRFQPVTAWSVDAGYAHLFVSKASSQLAPQSAAVPGVLLGQYDNSSDIFGVQATFSF